MTSREFLFVIELLLTFVEFLDCEALGASADTFDNPNPRQPMSWFWRFYLIVTPHMLINHIIFVDTVKGC